MRQIMAEQGPFGPSGQRAGPRTGHYVPSQDHPLLDHPAPAFVLPDARGKTWDLGAEVSRRAGRRRLLSGLHLHGVRHPPGRAGCGHARGSAQRGARVLAVSGDAPEFSLERIRKFGGFQIPLLSDADHDSRLGLRRLEGEPGR